MNAHHDTNSSAFGSAGLQLLGNHRTGTFSKLYGVWTYTWNDRNETMGFSEKNSSRTVIASGTYVYDSLDRRIGVDETSGGTTTQTWIVYNGNSNTPYAMFNGSGTLLERYLAGPSYVPGVTGMVARTNASGVTDWYLTGKLGSVRDIVNTSGTVIDHISYGAFGSIRAETNPTSGSQFKFDGMQYDTLTGLYNDWHRNYDSACGRFISQDSTSFTSLDTNLYRYGLNSLNNRFDITGYTAIAAHPIVGGAVVVGLVGGLIWYTGSLYYQNQMSAQIGWKIEYLRNGLTSLAIWDRINRLIALSKSPSISLPLQGTPGSTVFSNTPDGKPKQARRYASDGYPETDVDYDHTHHGHDSPHAHDWGRPVQGGRGPWRPIIPTDPVHPGY